MKLTNQKSCQDHISFSGKEKWKGNILIVLPCNNTHTRIFALERLGVIMYLRIIFEQT